MENRGPVLDGMFSTVLKYSKMAEFLNITILLKISKGQRP